MSLGWSAKEKPSRAWGEGEREGGEAGFVVFHEGLRLWEAGFVLFLRVGEAPGGAQCLTELSGAVRWAWAF